MKTATCFLSAREAPVPCGDHRFHQSRRWTLAGNSLSLSLSKLPRDGFGNAVNPLSGMGFNQGKAGTVVFARITPRRSSSLVLQTGKCRLLSFKDDVGTDLFTNAPAGMGDGIFSGNRPLEILAGADRGILGIKTRSARLPARAATRLTEEMLLVFGRTSEERVDSRRSPTSRS